MPHLVRLPPAVDQGGDAARLQHRHVSDDPGRAVAHGDGDAVALGDVPAAGQNPRQPGRLLVQLGEGQPLFAGDDGLDLAVQQAEGVEQAGQGGGEIGDDRPTLGVAADPDPPGLAGDLGQHRVIFAVERARHPAPFSCLVFFSAPTMKARAGRGKP